MSSYAEICSNINYNDTAKFIKEQGQVRIPGGYKRIVFTNGCFDILHPGHLSVLQHCRNMAGAHGAVVVGINDDASCLRLKGSGRPIFDQTSRGTILINMRNVDHVVTFEEDTPINLIMAIRPDVIVKGGDYESSNVVGKDFSLISIANFDDKWSTSKIIQKIKGNI